MPIPLVVNGTTYLFPVPGEDPTWGADATDWAKAVSAVLNTLVAPGDILQTTFSINNDVSVSTNINGLIFDSSTVRAANINYSIYRISTTNPSGQAETGVVQLTYDDDASVGSKWQLAQISSGGDAGVAININQTTGQLNYTSTDIGSLGYLGQITFTARVLNK